MSAQKTGWLSVRFVSSDSTLLLIGGTKHERERFAYAIHIISPRHNQPFAAIDCGMDDELDLETKIFGRLPHASDLANLDQFLAQNKGLLEQADGGTVFFEAIESLPLALQARLMRVICDKSMRRFCDTKPITVNIRVLASTDGCDLAAAVRNGTFREDLFNALNVLS